MHIPETDRRVDPVERVLLVEDDDNDAELVRLWLGRSPQHTIQVEVLPSLHGLAERARSVDCILLDLSIPGSGGLATLTGALEAAPDVPVVVLTGVDDEDLALEAMRLGAQDYLVKDRVGGGDVVRAVRYAIERRRVTAELRHLTDELRERTAALARSNEAIFRSAGLGMAQIDLDGTVTVVNPAMLQIIGRPLDDLVGRPLVDVVVERDRPHLADRLRAVFDGVVDHDRLEVLLERDDASLRLVTLSLSSLGPNLDRPSLALVTVEDVTDHRTDLLLEAHQSKLEDIGRLATGFAHEIRSPLQYVLTNLVHLSRTLPEVLADRMGDARVADALQALEDTESGVRRIGELVKGMNVLAHRADDEMGVVDLETLFEFPVAIARGRANTNMSIVVELPSPAPSFEGNAGLLRQVVLNLLVNAIDALLDDGPRPDATVWLRGEVSDDEVIIEVEDNGPGMAEDVLSEAFKPFFTTKPAGVGTGQGLSLVEEVVARRHGGRLQVTSAPDAGACFRIILPRRQPGATGAAPSPGPDE